MDMIKEINFDMDGTIANLYAVKGWLKCLQSENVKPYAEAEPMLDMIELAEQINRLQILGYKVNIISWLCKNGSATYNREVTEIKRQWLKINLPSVKFDKITIVKYGTPKSTCGKGILFDDEINNRNEWHGTAYDVENILEILKKIS